LALVQRCKANRCSNQRKSWRWIARSNSCGLTSCWLLNVVLPLSAHIQVVEVHDGVEEQGEAALRLFTPHGIDGEEDDVSFAHGRINDSRFFCQLVAADHHA